MSITKRIISILTHRWLKRLTLAALLAAICILAAPFVWRLLVGWHYERYIYAPAAAPHRPVALVFGAGIDAEGNLSDVLRDRMDVAIELYEAGAVDILLLSGDNRFENYDEPGAMMAYALAQGVPATALQPDYGGRRTYDSCFRARYIFQVDEAILVTQQFHLPRALLTCRQLGLDAVGVGTDLQSYARVRWFALREVAATAAAGWDLLRRQPAPVMGEPLPLARR